MILHLMDTGDAHLIQVERSIQPKIYRITLFSDEQLIDSNFFLTFYIL